MWKPQNAASHITCDTKTASLQLKVPDASLWKNLLFQAAEKDGGHHDCSHNDDEGNSNTKPNPDRSQVVYDVQKAKQVNKRGQTEAHDVRV